MNQVFEIPRRATILPRRIYIQAISRSPSSSLNVQMGADGGDPGGGDGGGVPGCELILEIVVCGFEIVGVHAVLMSLEAVLLYCSSASSLSYTQLECSRSECFPRLSLAIGKTLRSSVSLRFIPLIMSRSTSNHPTLVCVCYRTERPLSNAAASRTKM